MDSTSPPPDDDTWPALLSDLIAQAAESDLAARRAAVEGLYELAYKLGPRIATALPVLLEALFDPDDKVGESATWALHYCAPDSIDPLIDCLAHPLPHVRTRAAQALGNIGVDALRAAPALCTLLADATPAVRRRAAWALGLLRDASPHTLAALWTMAEQGESADLAAALHAVGNIGRDHDEPALLQPYRAPVLLALHHANADVRWSAGYAAEFLQLAPQDEADLLAGLLAEETVERVAERHLQRLAALAPMVDLAQHLTLLTRHLAPSGRSSRLACALLAAVRPAPLAAIPALLPLLDDPDLRLPAAQALWRIEGRADRILPALALEFTDNGEGVCDLVCEMGTAAAPLLPQLLNALGQDDYWDLQWAAADALCAVASAHPPVSAALMDALSHPSPIVRSAAARALARIGEPALPLLRTALADGNDARATWAAYALGEMGSAATAALPELRRGLAAPQPMLANCCAIAVAQVAHDTTVVPQLARLLASQDPEAPRRAAAAALAQLGPAAAAAVPALEALLDALDSGDGHADVDPVLADAAAAALAALRAPRN